MNHETMNNWRVFPRIFLLCFTIATGAAINWYLSFPLEWKVQCNQELMLGLLDREIKTESAEKIACRPVEAIGRPNGYTVLLSTLIGACGGVFAFYTNSGPNARRKDE